MWPSFASACQILGTSETFEDAISITKRLGFSLLWIDSLCILQDSLEDWLREASTMGRVYAGAVCTIAATSSEADTGGCFFYRDHEAALPLRFAVLPSDAEPSSRDNILIDVCRIDQWIDEVDGGPLNRRGWTFQEVCLI